MVGDGVEVGLVEGPEVQGAGQVLAQQAVGVLVAAALPRRFMKESVATLKANGFERATLANGKDIDCSDYREVDLCRWPPVPAVHQRQENC